VPSDQVRTTIDDRIAERVLAAIDEQAVAQLALELGNIDSPAGAEGRAAEFVHTWLAREGFDVRTVGLFPDRPNVVARWPGSGSGCSLLFNSHLDTSVGGDEIWSTQHAADPIYHSAWRDGDYLYGNGVCNDKGQMAAWLIACKAVKDRAPRLAGDLVLTAVCGEIEIEPVDEFAAPRYSSRELGSRYVIARGAIADYALVAEATDFRLGWVEAGNLFFKITVFGAEPPIYTSFIERPRPLLQSQNANVLLAEVITRLDEWALRYEQAHRYECQGGIVVPRVNIGAIRGGLPYKITKTAQNAAVYLDARITPVQRPLDVKAELTEVLRGCGVPFQLELYTYRRGFEAVGVEPLVTAVGEAHRRILGGSPGVADPAITSLWRDLNAFAEAGIPCVMYGPGPSVGHGDFSIRVGDLANAARLYALIALGITSLPRHVAAP
jgi:acetylornithine deacetylase/succinyl-diaminopimelate desuccinylase-like protein